MLDEARGLDVVAVVQHEFDIVGGVVGGLAELRGSHRPIDQRHRHRLALVVAEHQAIAAGKAGRFLRVAGEVVDHLAFGQFDLADGHGKAQFLDEQLDLRGAIADLGGKRMRIAVAALRRIPHRQQEAFVGPRQVLQPCRAAGREGQRLAGQVGRGGIARRNGLGLDQAVGVQQVGDARHRLDFLRRVRVRVQVRVRVRIGDAGLQSAFGLQREVQQALRIVIGRPEYLPARHVLEGRRDSPAQPHRAGIERQRVAEARQRGAIRAQQEHRLDLVAGGLLQGQRGEMRVVQRALGHHAGDGQRHLLADLGQRQFRHGRIAAAICVDHAV
ncbi:hypothetical protein OJJOAM_004452 [Cupriavidus sp. H18C1]